MVTSHMFATCQKWKIILKKHHLLFVYLYDFKYVKQYIKKHYMSH